MSANRSQQYAPLDPARQAELQTYRLASFRSRAGAIILDGLVVVGAIGLVSMSTGLQDFYKSEKIVLSLDFDSLASVAIVTAYFSLTNWLWNGRTLGKYLWRIRVIPIAEERLSASRSIQRALAYSVSTAVAGLGFFQYFRHPNRQTVHDRIAETLVVVDETVAARRTPDRAKTGRRP